MNLLARTLFACSVAILIGCTDRIPPSPDSDAAPAMKGGIFPYSLSDLVVLDDTRLPPQQFAFSSDGELLAYGSESGVFVYDIANRRTITVPGIANSPIAFSPKGRILAMGSTDTAVRLWNYDTKKDQLVIKKSFNSKVISLAFSPDGKSLALGGGSVLLPLFIPFGEASLWEVGSGKQLWQVSTDMVHSITFSPDGSEIACGCSSGIAHVSDPPGKLIILRKDGKRLKEFVAQIGQINSLAFSPDGGLLASSSDDMVRLWSTSDWTLIHSWQPSMSASLTVDFTRDGHSLLMGEDDGVEIWDSQTNARYPLDSSRRINGPATFSPDGMHVAVGLHWGAGLCRFLSGSKAP